MAARSAVGAWGAKGARGLARLALGLLVACGGGGGDAVDGAPADAEPPADGGPPRPGFGALSGACGVIDEAEWASSGSFWFENTLDFGADGYTDDDLARLSAGGQEIVADGNAGGSSLLSEVFAFEVLHRCEWADLLKTETEILYDGEGKITDLLVTLDQRKVGVSVTRAYHYPPEEPYPLDEATALLEGKLADVLASTAHVVAEDAWVRQILHVLAYAPAHAATLADAYAALDPALTADTLVVVTVTEGDDEAIY